MTTRFIGHLLTGNHAARPAASAVPEGTLYSCTTHSLVYQSDTSSWAQWMDAGAATISAGSNSTRVRELSTAGASTTLWSPFDHAHDGIGTITASSSNTLQRGTVNLRSGNNISFGLTDSDGDGEFDTVTVHGAAAGGGGSSLTVADEGTPLSTAATTLDFVGAGVTASGTGATKTITISGGGGGLAHSFIGYNTVGASTQTFAADTTYYAKKVTLASAGLLCNVGAYLSNSSSNDVGINAAVFTDIAGAVGIPIAMGDQLNNQSQVILTTTARWLHVPVSIYLAAGSYWIAIRVNRWSSNTSIAYDTGGSDVSFGSAGAGNSLPSSPSTTDTTRKLSIRASLLS